MRVACLPWPRGLAMPARDHLRSWPRDIKGHYYMGKVIGAGSFGTVREAQEASTGRRYAVKTGAHGPHARGPRARGPHARGPHARGPHALVPHACGCLRGGSCVCMCTLPLPLPLSRRRILPAPPLLAQSPRPPNAARRRPGARPSQAQRPAGRGTVARRAVRELACLNPLPARTRAPQVPLEAARRGRSHGAAGGVPERCAPARGAPLPPSRAAARRNHRMGQALAASCHAFDDSPGSPIPPHPPHTTPHLTTPDTAPKWQAYEDDENIHLVMELCEG